MKRDIAAFSIIHLDKIGERSSPQPVGGEKMKRTLFIMLVGVFVVGLCSGYSMAYTGPTFYKEGSMHGVKYLTGGVGLDERAVMEKAAKGNYNLQLVFDEATGPYLADIKVDIQGKDGKKLVDMSTNGPWFFVELPNGQYTVTVTHDGKSELRHLDVAKNFQRVIFSWKAAM
jgi:hypothetical protein